MGKNTMRGVGGRESGDSELAWSTDLDHPRRGSAGNGDG